MSGLNGYRSVSLWDSPSLAVHCEIQVIDSFVDYLSIQTLMSGLDGYRSVSLWVSLSLAVYREIQVFDSFVDYIDLLIDSDTGVWSRWLPQCLIMGLT